MVPQVSLEQLDHGAHQVPQEWLEVMAALDFQGLVEQPDSQVRKEPLESLAYLVFKELAEYKVIPG